MKHFPMDSRVNQKENHATNRVDSLEQTQQKRQRARETQEINKKLDGPNRPAE